MDLVRDDRLSAILEKKSISEMKKFVKERNITGSLAKLLLHLPMAFGNYEELMAFKDYVKDFELLDAIDSMAALYQTSSHKDQITFDLSMVPSQAYYTGVMIKCYSYYSAYPILSGGRYDKLLNYFENDVPAIGFSYHLNTLLNAYIKEGEADD
jgi:ATP phosphoribosyltransferase regulatory subunit